MTGRQHTQQREGARARTHTHTTPVPPPSLLRWLHWPKVAPVKRNTSQLMVLDYNFWNNTKTLTTRHPSSLALYSVDSIAQTKTTPTKRNATQLVFNYTFPSNSKTLTISPSLQRLCVSKTWARFNLAVLCKVDLFHTKWTTETEQWVV